MKIKDLLKYKKTDYRVLDIFISHGFELGSDIKFVISKNLDSGYIKDYGIYYSRVLINSKIFNPKMNLENKLK